MIRIRRGKCFQTMSRPAFLCNLQSLGKHQIKDLCYCFLPVAVLSLFTTLLGDALMVRTRLYLNPVPGFFTLRHLGLIIVSCIFFCSVTLAQSQDRPTDTLHKLNESVDALIKKVSPSVVQILVTGYGPLEEGERGNT